MCLKKIAIYVEGQTEQLVLNRLIKLWWDFSDINIKNIKILSGQDDKSSEVDFYSSNPKYFFLIIDVGGEGSLASAISNRSNKQHEQGFNIIGLRDLYAQDFDSLPSNIDRQAKILNNFKDAFRIMKCPYSNEINIFFAVMEIEAWLLVFPNAISKWAKISEKVVLDEISKNAKKSNTLSIEIIKRPSVLLSKIGKLGGKNNAKSHGSITSILNQITRDQLEEVYASNVLPHFNKFWNHLLEVLTQNMESP